MQSKEKYEIFIDDINPPPGEQKCGLVPTKVFLSKGEKRQLVFWTDQDYRLESHILPIFPMFHFSNVLVQDPSTTPRPVAPVFESPAPSTPSSTTTTATSTTPSNSGSYQPVEGVDTFLQVGQNLFLLENDLFKLCPSQAVNGQLPGFGNSKEPEESDNTELKEEDAVKGEETEVTTDIVYEDLVDTTANVWTDPDVEVFNNLSQEETNQTNSVETTILDDIESENTVNVEAIPTTTAEVEATTISTPEVEAMTITSAEVETQTTTKAEVEVITTTSEEVKDPTTTASGVEATTTTTSEVEATTTLKTEVEATTTTKADIEATTTTKYEVEFMTTTSAEVETPTTTKAEVEVITTTSEEDVATTTVAEVEVTTTTTTAEKEQTTTTTEEEQTTITTEEEQTTKTAANEEVVTTAKTTSTITTISATTTETETTDAAIIDLVSEDATIVSTVTTAGTTAEESVGTEATTETDVTPDVADTTLVVEPVPAENDQSDEDAAGDVEDTSEAPITTSSLEIFDDDVDESLEDTTTTTMKNIDFSTPESTVEEVEMDETDVQEATTVTVPAIAASIVEDVEEVAWSDTDNTGNSNLPQIDAVLAETTTIKYVQVSINNDIYQEDSIAFPLVQDLVEITTMKDEAMATESEMTTVEAEESSVDPTLDYDISDNIVFPTQTVHTGQTFGVGQQTATSNDDDDDTDNSDKVSIVTSMPLGETNVEMEDLDQILVVTSSPVEDVPVLDALDDFVSSIKDVINHSTSEIADALTTMKIPDVSTEESQTSTDFDTTTIGSNDDNNGIQDDDVDYDDDFVTTSTISITSESPATEETPEELIKEFQFFGSDNGFIHQDFTTTVKPAEPKGTQTVSETTSSTSQQPTIISTKRTSTLPSLETTTDIQTTTTLPDETIAILFNLDTDLERSTYFPIRDNEIQDDDVYEDLSDLEIGALVSDNVFDETTTGSPINIEENVTKGEHDFALEAVESEDIPDDDIIEVDVVPVNLAGNDAEDTEYDEAFEENEIKQFDETTTGAPLENPGMKAPAVAASTADIVGDVEGDAWSDPSGMDDGNLPDLGPETQSILAEEESTENENGDATENIKIFDETTTGAPINFQAPDVQPVVAEADLTEDKNEDENEQFNETTTGAPLEKPVMTAPAVAASTADIVGDVEGDVWSDPSGIADGNLPDLGPEIQSVLAEEEATDNEFEDATENIKIFDETTTETSFNFQAPDVQPVVAEEESTENKDEDATENIKIFDETTTGAPLNFQPPAVQPVVADLQTPQEFDETTTGSYGDNSGIQDDDVDYDSDNETAVTNTISITSENTVTEETPAFTTASSKNTTTTPLDSLQMVIDSNAVNFPADDYEAISLENDDEVLDMIKAIINKDVTDETTTEADDETLEMTTVRVEVSENIVETTSRKIISASKITQENNDVLNMDEENPTETTITPTTKKPKKESAVVQVQADGVNGPLNLDEPIYYDDTEDDVKNEIEAITSIEESNVEATTLPMTTVINGFIVSKNPILETLDNNGIETVRTGGEIMVEISTQKDDITTKDMEVATFAENSKEVTSMDTPETNAETTIGQTEETESFTLQSTIVDEVTNGIDSTTAQDTEMQETTTSVLELVTKSTVKDIEDEDIDDIRKGTDVAEKDIEVDEEKDIEDEEEDTDKQGAPGKRPPSKYPITDLLNSIYRLVTGIRESSVAEAKAASGASDKTDSSANSVEIQYFDSPLAKPLNVHNSPREPVPFTTSSSRPGVEESVDLANSNTSPFKQLSAPDLTGFIPDTEKEDNVQYIFASPARKQEQPRTLSPFNSDALRVQEPPKVLVKEVQEEEAETSSFSLSSLLPSFFSNPAEKVQVAGNLPITVRDPGQKTKPSGGLLSSLFSRPTTTARPAFRPRPRPLRPDVPAQSSGGFMPLVPGRQRGQPVSIPLPVQGAEASQAQSTQFSPKVGAFSREDTSRMLRLGNIHLTSAIHSSGSSTPGHFLSVTRCSKKAGQRGRRRRT